MKIPLTLDADFDGMFTGIQQFTRRVQREMVKPGAGGQKSDGVMGSIFFPKGGKMNAAMKLNVRKGMTTMFRTMGQTSRQWGGRIASSMSTFNKTFEKTGVGKVAGAMGGKKAVGALRGVVGVFKMLSKEAKGFGAIVKENTRNLQRMAKAGMRSMGRGAVRMGRGAARGLARGGRAVARGAAFAGMMGARGLAGFVTSAYQEGVGAYEARANARLNAAPAMMDASGKAKFTSGAYMGYNSAQSAGIQGQAARMGLGSGKHAGRFAMEMQRGFGGEGTQFAAGISRRGGTEITSEKGMRRMGTTIKRIFGSAVASGLKMARLPEFMQAANTYAEQQLAITPDKKSMNDYVKQLAFVQGQGGASMMGKYGAQALGRIDQGIKGAGGPQQAFLQRAFGFGKGASYLDVVRRQEAGIGDAKNLPAIMKQLQSEYGAGEHGGLSSQGLLAFKGMGFGTTSMGEKFGKMFLGKGASEFSGLTSDQQKKRINEVMEGEKDKKLAPIAKRGFAAMASFGGVAGNLAKRFNQFAKLGSEFYGIKKDLTAAAIATARGIAPVIKNTLAPAAAMLSKFAMKYGPKLGQWLEGMYISIQRISVGLSAYMKGFSSVKGGIPSLGAKFTAGAGAYDQAMADLGKQETRQGYATDKDRIQGLLNKARGSKGNVSKSEFAQDHMKNAFAVAQGVLNSMWAGKDVGDTRIANAIKLLTQVLSWSKTGTKPSKDRTNKKLRGKK